MENEKEKRVWVSFCISTYKRPVLLKQQLQLLLTQTFKNFEIVISDNDPERSAEQVIQNLGDSRLKYFSNIQNLGMMKSFNKSVERSTGEYVVLVTDDDPIQPNMLQVFYDLVKKFPDVGIYTGCSRTGKKEDEIEIFDNQNFLYQILNPALTSNLLWSSCVIEKNVLLSTGGIPDYGSPHLADHAMIALCGTVKGGLFTNKMYSKLTSHDNNFSKGNINLYSIACSQFYELITSLTNKNLYIKNGENILIKHLDRWAIVAMFSLRKYYTYTNKDLEKIKRIDNESEKILKLNFMRHLRVRYFFKLLVFNLKRPLYQVKILK